MSWGAVTGAPGGAAISVMGWNLPGEERMPETGGASCDVESAAWWYVSVKLLLHTARHVSRL